MSSIARAWLGWHFDFHTPSYAIVGENLEATGHAAAFAQAGVREVVLFAKCHFGYSYYPTQIGTPHPHLQRDVFGEMLTALRNRDIGVLAYLSFGIDGVSCVRHPEWARQLSPTAASEGGGESEYPFTGASDRFISVCPFTSYVDESVLPQIREILQLYAPDGFWFDTMSALAPCYCASCRVAYGEHFGAPMPRTHDHPAAGQFGTWRRDRGNRLIARIADYCHFEAALLGRCCEIGFNQIGSLPHPEKTPDGVTMISLDPATYGAQSLQFSLNASYGATTDKKCDVLPTIFNQGWGDWSLACPLRLQQTAAAVWARGARLHSGDRLRPDGVLSATTTNALKIYGALKNRLDEILPAAPPAPDVLLLHSPTMVYGEDGRFFADGESRSHLEKLYGAHHLLLDAGASFGVVGEAFLKNHLCTSHLVVLPELTQVSDETEKLLREFVMRGGCVLLISSLPASQDASSWNWIGSKVEEAIWHDHIYLPPLDGGEPVLVRGNVPKAKTDEATVRFEAIEPMFARPGRRFGWGIAPPCFDSSGYAALTERKLGEGTVFWLIAPLCSDYLRHGNWVQAKWFSQLLPALAPRMRARLEDSTGGLELVVHEDRPVLWATLVNHRGEELHGVGAHNSGQSWARHPGPLPIAKATLIVTKPNPRSRVQVAASDMNFHITQQNDTELRITIEAHAVCGVLRLDWQE